MSVTMRRVMWMACLLCSPFAWPPVSSALGLGEIHLSSALNEPMNAEIDLLSATPDELSDLRATLASRETFTRYGIDKPAFLSTLTFKVGKGRDGRNVLQVRSADAVPEPFVTFLVEVNWARGRLMREYTVLLDPPAYSPGQGLSASVPAAARIATAAPATSTAPAPATVPARVSAPAPATAAAPVSAPTPATAAAPVSAQSPVPAAPSAPVSAPAPAPPVAPASAPAPVPAAASAPVPAVTRHPATLAAVAPVAPAADASSASPPPRSSPAGPDSIRVGRGDTLSKIARGLQPTITAPTDIDRTMIALYRGNHGAFGGNINILHEGAILRVPDADEIASLNQREASEEVQRQMDAWRGGEARGGEATATAGGHLRLVTPTAGGNAAGAGSAGGAGANATGSGNPGGGGGNAAAAETEALKQRVRDLETQLADTKRLIDVRNNELSDLQRRLSATAATAAAALAAATQPAAPAPPRAAAAAPAAATPPAAAPPLPTAAAPPTVVAPPVPAPPTVASQRVPTPAPAAPASQPPQSAIPAPLPAPPPKSTPVTPAADSGSWIDWAAANWWVPLAVLVIGLAGLLGFTAIRRQRQEQDADMDRFLDDTDVAPIDVNALSEPTTSKMLAPRKSADSFVVEESGPHPLPEFGAAPARLGDTTELKSPDDTLSNESPVNLDQGDPLSEADFHMAYGLYDQAADLVRIALEREPDRRDLRVKLLEIYFVWGNRDAFLQLARVLELTRDRAPAGEWDKIVIMGKQICPDEPMFAASTGGGRGAGAMVDLNLEGGENRVDIDLFGDPEGERSALDHDLDGDAASTTLESPGLHPGSNHLDFTLDAPERGADDSPTQEAPARDEPTVESELMNFSDAEFIDSPSFARAAEPPTPSEPTVQHELPAHYEPAVSSEPTVHHELPAHFEPPVHHELPAHFEPTVHDESPVTAELPIRYEPSLPDESSAPSELPTVEVPALMSGELRDRHGRRLPSSADQTAEVSIDDLGLDLDPLEQTDHPADAPTLVAGIDESSRRIMAEAERHALDAAQSARERDLSEMERELEASFVAEPDLGRESAPTVLMPHDVDVNATQRFNPSDFAAFRDLDRVDLESTSRLRSVDAESIDLDLDRLSTDLNDDETLAQGAEEEDLFSNEVFESTLKTPGADLEQSVDLDVGDAMFGVESPSERLKAQTNKLQPIEMGLSELDPPTMSEVGTKLDLARAYMDMGDPEGARSILEEVVLEGTDSQKQEASRLIESLPG